MSWRKGWTGGIERYRNRRIECRAWKAWMLISCCASVRPPSDLLDESLSQDIVDDDAMVLNTATHQCGSASPRQRLLSRTIPSLTSNKIIVAAVL